MHIKFFGLLLTTACLLLTACGPNKKGSPTAPQIPSATAPEHLKPAKPLSGKSPNEDISKPSTPRETNEAIQNLINKQKTNFPRIIAELRRDKKKTSHWIWWVFPTEMSGASEPLPKTKVDMSTVDELLKSADLDAWSEILEEIFSLLKASPKGPFKEANNQPNMDIIPGIDHGRIGYALTFWLHTAKSEVEKYPRFFAAMTDLAKFKWQ